LPTFVGALPSGWAATGTSTAVLAATAGAPAVEVEGASALGAVGHPASASVVTGRPADNQSTPVSTRAGDGLPSGPGHERATGPGGGLNTAAPKSVYTAGSSTACRRPPILSAASASGTPRGNVPLRRLSLPMLAGRHVMNPRRLAILFSLALLAPWIAPADPCAPVCTCCPRCTAQHPGERPPCHGAPSTSTASPRHDCPDCLKSGATLPDGVLAAGADLAPHATTVGVVPPEIVVPALQLGHTIGPAPSHHRDAGLSVCRSVRAPPATL
jgi:hypothetical protein